MSEADERIKRARDAVAASNVDPGIILRSPYAELWNARDDLFAAVDERAALRKENDSLSLRNQAFAKSFDAAIAERAALRKELEAERNRYRQLQSEYCRS